jgi:hypothetical protein
VARRHRRLTGSRDLYRLRVTCTEMIPQNPRCRKDIVARAPGRERCWRELPVSMPDRRALVRLRDTTDHSPHKNDPFSTSLRTDTDAHEIDTRGNRHSRCRATIPRQLVFASRKCPMSHHTYAFTMHVYHSNFQWIVGTTTHKVDCDITAGRIRGCSHREEHTPRIPLLANPCAGNMTEAKALVAPVSEGVRTVGPTLAVERRDARQASPCRDDPEVPDGTPGHAGIVARASF